MRGVCVSLTRLSDTSALVTLLAGDDVHTSAYSSRYRVLLDLSAGRSLLRRCTAVWPHLNELVKNRKKCILEETLRCIGAGTNQVIILGSGLDPLSLEIVSRTEGVHVYEVDAEQMDTKRELVGKAAPEAAGRITCVAADLARPPEVVRKVTAAGWDGSASSVLVLEGISYYLRQPDLWAILSLFGEDSTNDILMEYMVPPNMIAPERAQIPDGVFGVILQSLDYPMSIARFGHEEVRSRAEKINGLVVRRHTMRSIEFSRTGANRHFPTDESGWIEVAHIRTLPLRAAKDAPAG